MPQPTSRPAVDIMSGVFYAGDPHSTWAWMRRNEPVYHDEHNNLWGVTKHADVKACSVDPSTFSSAAGIRPRMPRVVPQMINMDPPDQTRRRKLVSAGFTPRSIAAMHETIGTVCDDILDAVCEAGTCDFVEDVAARLPLIMIANLLGVEEDRWDDLLRWSDTMLGSEGSTDPAVKQAALEAAAQFAGYIVPVIHTRRASGRTNDLIGILANAEVEGNRLTDEDLIYETILLLIGGDETTRHVLSGGLLALLENPEQLGALTADPGRIPLAVEEMLRWVSPVKNMVRTVRKEVTLGGVRLQEGSQLLLFYPSANRDEDVFADSDSFDISRHPNPHLAFGLGTHFCLGNQLGRLELQVMFEKLLQRLPDLRLGADADLRIRPVNFTTGLEHLPVEFTAGRRAG